ncbi:hypothetical protein BY996DRAFT_8400491, partial [Phakopsora pachyrhizi]
FLDAATFLHLSVSSYINPSNISFDNKFFAIQQSFQSANPFLTFYISLKLLTVIFIFLSQYFLLIFNFFINSISSDHIFLPKKILYNCPFSISHLQFFFICFSVILHQDVQ